MRAKTFGEKNWDTDILFPWNLLNLKNIQLQQLVVMFYTIQKTTWEYRPKLLGIYWAGEEPAKKEKETIPLWASEVQ